MADITKVNEQISAWHKNMERLENGEFGAYKIPKETNKALLAYWKSQEEAGYPNASENVKYFEDMVRKESEGEG